MENVSRIDAGETAAIILRKKVFAMHYDHHHPVSNNILRVAPVNKKERLVFSAVKLEISASRARKEFS